MPKYPTQNTANQQAVRASYRKQDMPQSPNGWDVMTEFLAAIYGPDKAADVWVTGFNDIENGASWFGIQGLDGLKNRVQNVDEADLYFCTGLLRPNASNRTLGEVVAQPVLYADDIGTKVDPTLWTAMFMQGFPEPTFRIETSPGNETWGWKLAGDPTTPERAADLALVRAYMIERGLTDALHDATRYLRLPWGHNSKPKYRKMNSKGRAPAVGYTDWKPQNEADIEAVGRALIGRDDWRNAEVPVSAMTSGASAQLGAGGRPRDASIDDPLVRMAEVIGLNPRQRTQGVVDALCPNWHVHSDRAETGFSFISSDGACFCNHASCDSLRTPDFLAMIRSQYEDHVSTLDAMEMNSEGLQSSASAFEAAATFEGVEVDPDAIRALSNKKTKPAGTAFERAAAVLSQGGRLFTDQRGVVWLSREGRLYNVSNKDRALLQTSAKLGENLTGNGSNNLFEFLLNCADPDAPRENVFMRQAHFTDDAGKPAVYVNRMECRRAVKISSTTWEDVPLSSVPLHMADRVGGLPLPLADKTANPDDFFKLLDGHLPLAAFDASAGANSVGVQQRAVILCALTAAFFRPGTVPHLMIAGQQGSGKTTMAKRLMALTDPDAAAVSPTLPSDAEKLFNTANNRLNLVVDNTSGITKAQSDILCAIASGSAHASRRLYTDADRSILQAKASVYFTSVLADVVRLPDLAQRTLRLEIPPIEHKSRRSENALNTSWAKDYPKILGALYGALSGGLARWNDVKTENEIGTLETPRLSDAAMIAEATARGLGWSDGLCMAALRANEKQEAARVLEDNPVATRIRALLHTMRDGKWSGTPAELEMAVANTHAAHLPNWDRNRLPFAGQYQRLWPSLEETWGIKRELSRTKNARRVSLALVAK